MGTTDHEGGLSSVAAARIVRSEARGKAATAWKPAGSSNDKTGSPRILDQRSVLFYSVVECGTASQVIRKGRGTQVSQNRVVVGEKKNAGNSFGLFFSSIALRKHREVRQDLCNGVRHALN